MFLREVPDEPMTLRISSHPAATPAHRELRRISVSMARSSRRLSSGLRIQTAADDAAGLGISERLRARIRSYDQARRNADEGIAMLNVGEGALATVSDLLVRMRELATQALNGTNGALDLKNLNGEYRALADEIARIEASATYNGIPLLDGSRATIEFFVGTDADSETIRIDTDRSLSNTLALGNSRLSNAKQARKAVKRVDRAIDHLSSLRGRFGSVQSRLTSTVQHLSGQFEAASAAESRIRDVDFARETAELTRQQILQQQAIAMIAQGNSQPALVLQLLQP